NLKRTLPARLAERQAGRRLLERTAGDDAEADGHGKVVGVASGGLLVRAAKTKGTLVAVRTEEILVGDPECAGQDLPATVVEQAGCDHDVIEDPPVAAIKVGSENLGVATGHQVEQVRRRVGGPDLGRIGDRSQVSRNRDVPRLVVKVTRE